MATSATPDASEVKRRGRQRLIGAVAIAILLVVFVPMILDSEPRVPKTGPALDIPPQDKAPPLPPPSKAPVTPAEKAPVAPVEKAPVAPVETGAQPKPQAPVTPVPQAPVTPVPQAPVTPVPQAPVTPVKTGAQPKLEGFAVQVGAFKEEDKLQAARDKLTAAKVSHYVERVNTPNGELKRLRAGPFPTREAADKALASIKAASLDGKVVPLP